MAQDSEHVLAGTLWPSRRWRAEAYSAIPSKLATQLTPREVGRAAQRPRNGAAKLVIEVVTRGRGEHGGPAMQQFQQSHGEILRLDPMGHDPSSGAQHTRGTTTPHET